MVVILKGHMFELEGNWLQTFMKNDFETTKEAIPQKKVIQVWNDRI